MTCPSTLSYYASVGIKSLHWLPVHYFIIFKISTIAYQALSSTQPVYLNSPARNSRQLRSTSSTLLYIPRVKTKAGTRAFSVAALTVLNSLPASVKSDGNTVSIRRCLKTYLFNAACPPQLLRFCRDTELDRRGYWHKRSLLLFSGLFIVTEYH